MNTLITGTFQDEKEALQAARKLANSCVPADLVRTILPGSRKRLIAHESEGGYPPKEPGGILVAVKAPDNVAQRLAVKILRDHGARNIECVNAERRASPRIRIRISFRSAQSPLPV